MLIDATHPEETRVVVADGNKVEEFDFESLNKRQLAGNIYLAKVTRVEPSLQAAFIDYGGNRHGFLAFSEIHPDYYQIPKADRDALLAEERADVEAQAAADEASDARARARNPDPEDADQEEGGADAAGEDDEKPKKSRSRSRSRGRRRKSEDTATEGADGTQDGAGETPEPEAGGGPDGIASGEGAELAEAATDAPEAAEADSEKDDGPVTTIAEDAGLEDETVTSGGSEAEARPDAEAAPEAHPGDAGASAVEARPDADPAGMETVDLSDGEDQDGDDALVEDPAPRRSRSRSRRKSSDRGGDRGETAERDDSVETVADDDSHEDIRPARKPRARKYKIQEVVKVRQIMLVQVVKEERGNKGAALTTYLSLAGRYCVLMPNTARGGGISRKITNTVDRKKLKEIAGEIDVPQGAGLIVRTAGAKRTKTEIKRDYEYLQRQWEQVRELTLRSIAPAPIYEEGNLIHRSIRDLYSREIDEVIVEGEAGYRQARDYMKLIMPSHAKNVKHHPEGGQPLFAKQGVETYLAGMFNPTVQLKSGGYIVIGITEALVAVDVNSGKSTKEGSIEDTATKTNLEAAEEVARQAKLRDLAGLIVIDFIDMDERRNNAAVEKRLKDSLKNDRARIQVGRISSFGLMEMSRQRLRPGMLEATTQECPHCHGTGLIRSDDSVALSILRALEEEGTRKRSREVLLKVPVDVCNYLMNDKREHLATIETRYGMAIRVVADTKLVAPDYAMEKFKTATRQVPKPVAQIVAMDTSWTSETEEEDEDIVAEADAEEAEVEAVAEVSDEAAPRGDAPRDDEDGQPRRKRRRRSRRRKGGNDGPGGESGDDAGTADSEATTDDAAEADAAVAGGPAEEAAPAAEAPEATDEKPKSRSRSRSRSRSKAAPEENAETAEAAPAEAPAEASENAEAAAEPQPEPEAESAPSPKRRARARAKAPAPVEGPSEMVAEAAEAAEAVVEARTEDVSPEPEAVTEPVVGEPVTEAEPTPEPDTEASETDAKPKKRGWWSFGS